MSFFQFASPAAFLLLLLIPGFAAWRLPWLKKAASRPAVTLSSGIELDSLAQSFRSRYGASIQTWLKTLSAILLVLALARPQSGTRFIETESSARDIMLVLDTSGSMLAMDFFLEGQRSNRLEALKDVVKKFIKGRPQDRIGLIVFGDHAFTQCPLTRDHKLLAEFIDATEVGIAGQGTAIGDALGIALKRLRALEADSKVIVLVTDGRKNAGTLSPKEAANLAKNLGVKIHTIGVGGKGTAPMPVRSVFGGTRLQARQMDFDEKTLKIIAAITGGQYFLAKNTEGLENVYSAIDALEERKEKMHEYIEHEERFFPFLLAGIFLYLLSRALDASLLHRIP